MPNITQVIFNKIKEKFEEKGNDLSKNASYPVKLEFHSARAYLQTLFDACKLIEAKEGEQLSEAEVKKNHEMLLTFETKLIRFISIRDESFLNYHSPVKAVIDMAIKHNLVHSESTVEEKLTRRILRSIFSHLADQQGLTEPQSKLSTLKRIFNDQSASEPLLEFAKISYYELAEYETLSIYKLCAAHPNDLCLAVDRDGYTLLHHAAVAGEPLLVWQLIAARVDINKQTKSTGDTALMLAIKNNSRSVVEELLTHRATDVYTLKNKDSKSAFDIALTKSDYEFYRKAFKRHDELKHSTPLMMAVLDKDLSQVKRLLALQDTDVTEKRKDGKDAFQLALDMPFKEVKEIRIAFIKSCRLNFDQEYFTDAGELKINTIHYVAHYDLVDTMKIMYERQKDCILKVSDDNRNACFYALHAGSEKVISWMLELKDAGLTDYIKSDRLVIREAALNCSLSCIIKLIEIGANPSGVNAKGESILHDLLGDSSFEQKPIEEQEAILRLVLKTMNAETLNAKDADGKTALDLAVKQKNTLMIQLLVEQPDTDISNTYQNRSLASIAQWHGWTNVLEAMKYRPKADEDLTVAVLKKELAEVKFQLFLTKLNAGKPVGQLVRLSRRHSESDLHVNKGPHASATFTQRQ